jgi:hypothetical protein
MGDKKKKKKSGRQKIGSSHFKSGAPGWRGLERDRSNKKRNKKLKSGIVGKFKSLAPPSRHPFNIPVIEIAKGVVVRSTNYLARIEKPDLARRV